MLYWVCRHMIRQRADLTYKYNRDKGRHGWIRLTPAYSIKVVRRFLADATRADRVLDPFSGTGTTGLVCGELGIDCTLLELNPFLVWLAEVKARNYHVDVLVVASELVRRVVTTLAQTDLCAEVWVPPIRFIERWWSPRRLQILAHVFAQIQSLAATAPSVSLDLLRVAFCRLVIEWSNAAFNHQSMSFKDGAQLYLFEQDERALMLHAFQRLATDIIQSAGSPVAKVPVVVEGDARNVGELVPGLYTRVITSPPYPNRMSYIRELRPYMYWLGFLTEARQAGLLDWEAIGGTWGIATSRVARWMPTGPPIEHEGFSAMLDAIAASKNKNSVLLANYVHRYFEDMRTHLMCLREVLAPGAQIVYVVGNSKFYDTLVPVEQIFASLMRGCGFASPRIEQLRKRNSKKELYEYAVIATVGA